MDKKIIIEASSIEAALSDVSKQWQIPAEKLKAEVLSEERKGFLGLGGKILKIEISEIKDGVINENEAAAENADKSEDKPGSKKSESEPTPARTKLLEEAAGFVNETLKLMDFNAEAVISESARNTLDIQGQDASDYVVGRYGDALKGMEYLVNLSLRDPRSEPRIKVDSCGYRERRTKSLERLAEATARQAVKYGRPVRLEPMASWERWVIHTTLKDRDDITTESVGEPPLRKVIIMPKYDPEREETGATGPATMRIRARRERIERQNERQPIDRERRRRRPRRRN